MGWNEDRIARTDGTRGHWSTVFGFGTAALGLVAVRPLVRRAVQGAIRAAIDTLLSDPYEENLWEFVSALRRTGAQIVVESSLRAREGTVIHRPLGSPKRWPHLDGLTFDFAQLARPPLAHDHPVDTSVTIGPAARRPLRVAMPILVSGMAYGLALSARARVALARGAALAGTAANAGEGPVHALERQAADKLIVQFNRATWGKERSLLQRADMVEIHFGQGAAGGVGGIVRSARHHFHLRTRLGIAPGRDAIIYSTHPEMRDRGNLREMVNWLRTETGGVPIGVKLAPGRMLEDDLQRALDAGVDVIALDGAQAATKGSPPILQDDFGIPTLYALVRAQRFLEESGCRDRVSLIVGGGLQTPGHFLKVLALGADAVYIGTIALFVIAHGQTMKSLPWEPPTQLVFFGGHQADQLDVDEAADRLARFLRSCTEEMAIGARALGKASLRDVSRDDLMALDPVTAEICGVPLAYEPVNDGRDRMRGDRVPVSDEVGGSYVAT